MFVHHVLMKVCRGRSKYSVQTLKKKEMEKKKETVFHVNILRRLEYYFYIGYG